MDPKRESIFTSMLRAFFKTVGIALGLIAIVISFMILIPLLSQPHKVADKTQLTIAPDANGVREQLGPSAPAILKININGLIGTNELSMRTIQAQLLDAQDEMGEKGRIKAILLCIDSPGGSSVDSFDIYQALLHYKARYKLPIYAFVNGMCASGGMLVACAADKIFASPSSLIGSVGVKLGPFFSVTGLMERYGVKAHTFTEGKDKDLFNPFEDWDLNNYQSVDDYMRYTYDLFLDIVTKARPRMSRDKLINSYGAKIFVPPTAEEYGYIDDGNSSYSEVVRALAEEAKTGKQYQVIELKVIRPMLPNLMCGSAALLSGKIKHEIEIPGALPSELSGRLLYLYSPT